jgi:hypothetical protein
MVKYYSGPRSKELLIKLFFSFLTFLLLGSIKGQGLINAGSYITIGSGTYVTINGSDGNVTSTGASAIELGGTIEVQGNWINNGSSGVSTAGSGTLTDGNILFTGGNAQIIGGSTASIFENVNINKMIGSSIDLNVSNCSIKGNLDITLGALNANSNNLNVSKNFTRSASAIFYPQTGTVTLDGNTTQAISVNCPLYNLVVNNSTGGSTDINITQPLSITGTSTFTDGIAYFTGTGSLTYSLTAASNQGSASSFVDGLITKSGANNFTFPTGDVVGANAVWAPIAIAAPAVSSTITAEYLFTSSPNNWNLSDMCNPATLDHTSGVEYWQLNRTAGSGAYPAVTLYWKNATRSGITNLSDLVVAHYEACSGPMKWANMGGSAINDGGGTGHITSSVAFTSYSPVTFGTRINSNPLPVELIDLSSSCKGNEVEINWSTASENANAGFKIERSYDALDWSFLGFVNGAGNSNSVRNYSYIDHSPLSTPAYYQITQIDYNGDSREYSPVYADCDREAQTTFSLYPNPAENYTNIYMNEDFKGSVKVILMNSLGQKILVTDFLIQAGSEIIPIDLSGLADAVYYVTLASQDKIFPTQQLIINR